ncbi:streptomycin 3''-adenylyltransferase [Geomicrobium sp. JCM 19039]|nr:streptomycin 3''-adenylyltransferase [Geomicrobium sp. JCM 19039]
MLYMDDQIDDYLDRLATTLQSLLKKQLTGVYLSGSLVMDDWIPTNSDVDVMCIVDRPLKDSVKLKLVDQLAEERLDPPGSGLELVFVLEDEVIKPHSLPSYEYVLTFQQNIGVKVKEEGMDEGLLMDFTICYQSGKTLIGKPIEEVFGVVPKPWLNEAMKGSLRWHKAHVFHPFYDPYGHEAVLNACRTWCFKENGRMTSKTKGALWAVSRWSDSDVVSHALSIREGSRTDRLDEERVHAILDHVMMMQSTKLKAFI